MVRSNVRRLRIAAALVLLMLSSMSAEIISGSSSLSLNTPATPEIRNEAVTVAADSLKNALYVWLQESMQTAPDLNNPVIKHFFNLFAKSCIKRAKQDSYFEGHEWTLNLDVKDTDVREAVAEHNAWCDSIASENWKIAQDAIAANRYPAVYNACIHTIFYAMGRMGGPTEQQNIAAQARSALQEFLGKLKIVYSSPIIKGKLGDSAETVIDVTVSVGDVPLPGMVLLARLPDGMMVTTLTTDAGGKATLANIKMPFVAYGTFLHVVPNFGAVINPGYIFEASAFGIKLNESQDQTLIFNVVKPVYSLNYQAVAANKIEIPADFSSDARLRKFLQDSCHMQPQAGTGPVDLAVDITCQVSSYTFDEREETEMKVEMQASIKQQAVGGGAVERTALLHKKAYDSNHPIPMGLFFWETTNALKKQIREMLVEL